MRMMMRRFDFLIYCPVAGMIPDWPLLRGSKHEIVPVPVCCAVANMNLFRFPFAAR
jgi:hypothetical protein